jgi:hypothetical protein
LIHNFSAGKSSTKTWANSVFKKSPKEKIAQNAKIAQSGHPGLKLELFIRSRGWLAGNLSQVEASLYRAPWQPEIENKAENKNINFGSNFKRYLISSRAVF